jgi:hypothetical protein
MRGVGGGEAAAGGRDSLGGRVPGRERRWPWWRLTRMEVWSSRAHEAHDAGACNAMVVEDLSRSDIEAERGRDFDVGRTVGATQRGAGTTAGK